MRPPLLASLLVAAVIAFIAGVIAAPAISALRSDGEPSCPAERLELEGILNSTGEVVRLCYPPTWYVEPPNSVRLMDGSQVTGSMAFLRAVRLHEVRQELSPGFVHVSSTQVLAVLQVIDPATAKQMGGPPCMTDDPLQQDGDLRTCKTSSSAPGTGIDGPTMIETVYFITADGYRIEGRAFPPYGPGSLPSSDEYAGLAEQWPGILADMTEIARDFASRAGERDTLPLPPTPSPMP